MWKFNPDTPDDYLGNIWGWKFSIFGAVLMLGLIILAIVMANYRGISVLDAAREAPVDKNTSPIPADSFRL